MTQQEIFDAWVKWMHRNDLTADLATVYGFAGTMIAQRYLGPIDLDPQGADYQNQGNMWQHAGLVYLAELAQDDAQLQRESVLFDNALRDYTFFTSLKTPAPQMMGT